MYDASPFAGQKVETDELPNSRSGTITHAVQSRAPASGQITVDVTMTAEGANRWSDMTQENIGRAIAIVFDGKVVSCEKDEKKQQ